MSRKRSTNAHRFRAVRRAPETLAGVTDRLQRAMRRQFRRAAHGDPSQHVQPLLHWARQYLPHYFKLPPSLMHRWLESQFDTMVTRRGTKLNVIGPRGAAKSTLGALAWPLRLAVEGREPYVWIISDTMEQAHGHLENIKAELIGNQALAEAYPESVGRGPVWRENALTLNNGVAIEAFGSGQRLRGRKHGSHRPSLIVCDDLQNDQHSESAAMREHSRRWFHGMLLKAGNKNTNVVNLATALHGDALGLELTRTPGWTSRVFRAIERWPDNMSLWSEWETIYADLARPDPVDAARRFYDEHRAAMDAGAELLWPEEEDLYTLMCMRVESGRPAFEREKQGSPVNPELCEWPESYFEATIWFDDWPRELQVKTLVLDPSKGSESRHGDYSALVMLGVDRHGLLYVDADLARRPTPQMVADTVECYRQFQPDVFGIEANQFQDLLAPALSAEFAQQGMLIRSPYLLVNTVNKQVRIRRLGQYLSLNRLRFKANSPSTRLLVQQLKEFPLADHDDGPDALEMAIRLASEWLEPSQSSDGLGDRLPVSVD
jgi:predicted phage terminase large subunit-like protein